MPSVDPKLRLLVRHSDSSKDLVLVEELLGHLKPLQRFANLDVWSDARLRAGDETRREIERAIDQADVVLLLLSADFFGSDTLLDVEVPKLLEKHRQGSLKVVPVLLRSCLWEAHPWLSELRPLPRDGKPVASHQGDDFDRILTELVKEIAGFVMPSMSGSTTESPRAQAPAAKVIPPTESGPVYNIHITGSNIGGLGVGPGANVSGKVDAGQLPTKTVPVSGGEPAASPAATKQRVAKKAPLVPIVLNGTQLTDLISGAQAIRVSNQDCQTDEDAALVGSFLQECSDLIEVLKHLEIRQQIEQARSLSKDIEALAAKGWLVFALQTREVFHPMASGEFPVVMANVRVVRKDSPEIVSPFDEVLAKWKSPEPPSTPASVYLSYGDDDLPFAGRLHEALEAAGVPVFFRAEHAALGSKHHRSARKNIREYEHVILLCSERSLSAPSVMSELDEMLSREFDDGASERIIPVLFDDYVAEGWAPRHPDIRRAVLDRVPLDMKGADGDRAKFEKAMKRLLGALKG